MDARLSAEVSTFRRSVAVGPIPAAAAGCVDALRAATAGKDGPESSQNHDVPRYGMVSVITFHNPFQPPAYNADRLMHLPAQLLFQRQKLRPHPLGRRPTPYDKGALGVRPTIVSEPQERERLRFSFTPLFPVDLRESTKLDQSRFLRMKLQTELRQPLLKFSQKPLGFRPVLESRHEIVA